MMTSPDILAKYSTGAQDELRRVTECFPFRISSYYRNLIRFSGDPIWRQAVPDLRELEDLEGLEDPLAKRLSLPCRTL
jgi:lysine 2,3-aminomutase